MFGSPKHHACIAALSACLVLAAPLAWAQTTRAPAPATAVQPAPPATPIAPAPPLDAASPAPRVAPATGAPTGAGKWVTRSSKTTCPSGSVSYVDEVHGGVKCWVDTN